MVSADIFNLNVFFCRWCTLWISFHVSPQEKYTVHETVMKAAEVVTVFSAESMPFSLSRNISCTFNKDHKV